MHHLHARIKISVIMDISILPFYGYIRYIGDILVDILTQNIDELKIDKKNYKNVRKKFLKIKLEV